MYLKSIEVNGFKSFANKITFQFHNGITAIVGPNGSGKSNVADAVRWVLGEQKVKQLRSSNMQDVIFSGTELRKPMGYASVAITIDNTDHQLDISYEEVTVTRRLYRSGESEYLLNGSMCRLRDINELFYDTGIGKEGYSIIGQGQIDQILSGKPEERRALFDEAAGIVKFKRRKESAQKKLEAERADLTRANDILSEIEKRLGPLEKQSDTAKLYLKKRDEQKACDVSMFLLEVKRLKKALTEVETNQAQAQEQLQAANDANSLTKQEYDRIENLVASADAKLEEKRAAYNEATERKLQMEGQMNLLKEQIRLAQISDETLSERLKETDENLTLHKIELEKLQKEKADNEILLKTLYGQEQAHQTELETLRKKMEEENSRLEAYQAELIELLNRLASLKAEEQKFDTMLEQVQKSRKELSHRLDSVESGRSSVEEEIRQQETALESVSAQIQQTTEEGGRLDEQLAETKRNMQESNQSLQKIQETFLRKKSHLETLTNMTERYEGFGNSIKRVMEKKDENPGIIGVVADIIQTEKKYETAIETALGGSIQNIVTEDEDTAKAMIRYLKEHRFGRATFLPLTSIRGGGRKENAAVLKEPGVIASAKDLVTTDKKHDAVKEYLLGRIYVVDHMDHAVRLAGKYNYTLKIVTLEGELLNPGGSMTGGAFKNAGNLLGRRREIEELTVSVRRLEKEKADLQKKIEAQKKVRDNQRDNIQQQKERLQKQYLRQNTIRMKLNQVRAQEKALSKQSVDIKQEKDHIELQLEAVKSQKERIANQEQKVLDRKKLLEEEVLKLQEQAQEQKLTEQEYAAQAVSSQVEYANVVQKADFTEQNFSRVTEELQNLQKQYDGLLESSADSTKQAKQKEQEKNALEKEIETAQESVETLQSELTALQADKEKLTADNRGFFDRREELSERIALLDKECYRLNSQKERLEEAREEQISYMWDEYELTYSSAEALPYNSNESLSELKKRSKELRNEIRELGPVNVSAIEEYKETAERYDFLKTQRDDLTEAEGTLLKIIEQLDEGMRKQFSKEFDRIKAEFDKAFKELFGGGKGTLEMVEDEDILEAGIRIIAQPPGKKLQNMMQLSGGEKALTAIALLFAIQNLKPSPFCLLDEIEAALDDSNVGRFAGYLHKLTEHTQFIMITHRRGTMAAADRLYGITMQEKGVSTLVSVNLIEEQLT